MILNKKWLLIITLVIFSINLDAINLDAKNLYFCDTKVDTRTLLSDFKDSQKKFKELLKETKTNFKGCLESNSRESCVEKKGDIKKSSVYISLNRKKTVLKCIKYQTQYNRYAKSDYRNSKSNATIFKTINFLKSVKKTQYLKEIVSNLENNQIKDLSPIKLRGKNLFGLDIGFKKGRSGDFYIGFFYLENGEAKYEQITASRDYFKKDKRVKISNIDFGISEEKSKIALAFEIENALGEYKFQNPKILKDYLADNKVSVSLDGEKTTDIPFLSVSGITPSLDKVGFYLRDGEYTLEIRGGKKNPYKNYQNEYQFDKGEFTMKIDFPDKNEIYVKKVEKPTSDFIKNQVTQISHSYKTDNPHLNSEKKNCSSNYDDCNTEEEDDSESVKYQLFCNSEPEKDKPYSYTDCNAKKNELWSDYETDCKCKEIK